MGRYLKMLSIYLFVFVLTSIILKTQVNRSPQRSEEGIKSPGTEVTGNVSNHVDAENLTLVFCKNGKYI